MAGSSLTDFGPQLKSLAGPDLTLVAWDPPGYGQSRPPGRQFGPGFYREDALTAAALMQVTVEGWSLVTDQDVATGNCGGTKRGGSFAGVRISTR